MRELTDLQGTLLLIASVAMSALLMVVWLRFVFKHIESVAGRLVGGLLPYILPAIASFEQDISRRTIAAFVIKGCSIGLLLAACFSRQFVRQRNSRQLS